jgi:enamine deaminase RidA (YjgF/YER057c/UK114 family)
VFTAGVGPHDPASGEIVGSTIEEQTQQALLNLEAVLSARELGRDDVVKVTVHLEELDRDFAGFDAAYRKFFRDPFPVRTTVGSRLDGILLEIDCIAMLDANQ